MVEQQVAAGLFFSVQSLASSWLGRYGAGPFPVEAGTAGSSDPKCGVQGIRFPSPLWPPRHHKTNPSGPCVSEAGESGLPGHAPTLARKLGCKASLRVHLDLSWWSHTHTHTHTQELC